MLKKNDGVATLSQGAGERAIGSPVAIAPGRRDGKPKDYDLHLRHRRSGAQQSVIERQIVFSHAVAVIAPQRPLVCAIAVLDAQF